MVETSQMFLWWVSLQVLNWQQRREAWKIHEKSTEDCRSTRLLQDTCFGPYLNTYASHQKTNIYIFIHIYI